HPQERRILVLPPEQATFAGLLLGGLWAIALSRPTKRGRKGTRKGHPYHTRDIVSCMVGVPLAGTLLARTPLALAGTLLARTLLAFPALLALTLAVLLTLI